MRARLRTSSNYQRVSVKSPRSLEQRFLDRAGNNSNRRIGPNASLQIGNTLARFLDFVKLNLFLELQLHRKVGIGGLDGMNNLEVTARFRRCLMGIAEHSF